jgi:hypothetical protein
MIKHSRPARNTRKESSYLKPSCSVMSVNYGHNTLEGMTGVDTEGAWVFIRAFFEIRRHGVWGYNLVQEFAGDYKRVSSSLSLNFSIEWDGFWGYGYNADYMVTLDTAGVAGFIYYFQ